MTIVPTDFDKIPEPIYRKGNRVCWKDKSGEIKHGTVDRGGKKTVVIVDGGEFQVSGPSKCFRPSPRPLPVDRENPMSRYSIKNFRKTAGHDDSLPFVCTICYDGKPLCTATDDGWGGDIEIRPVGNNEISYKAFHKNNVHNKLYEDCKAWLKFFGDPNPFCGISTWIMWYQFSRPYAVTAEEYIKKQVAETAAILGKEQSC